MNSNFDQGALAARMNITAVSVADDRSSMVISMPVEGNTQPYGILHGGANGVLVEHVASGLAMLNCPDGLVPVGVDLNVTHLRGVTSGHVEAEGSIISQTRSSLCVHVDIRQGERLTATGRLSLRFVPPLPA